MAHKPIVHQNGKVLQDGMILPANSLEPLHQYPARVETHWELWTYDVWGNKEDGYEVNDRSCFDRDYVINAKVHIYNPGIDREFASIEISDYQMSKAFGLRCKWQDPYSNGIPNLYLERDSDGYPIGEMYCTSHESSRVLPVAFDIEALLASPLDVS